MEIKKLLCRKLSEQRGSSILITVGILVAIMTFYLCITEYLRVSDMYDAVKTNLERASNIAIEYSMIDEARGYHISVIDPDETEKQFNTYFITRLGLTSDFEKISDGRTCYKVNFETYEIDPEIPRMKLQGTIDIKLELVGDLIPSVNLPFDITTRNVNIED